MRVRWNGFTLLYFSCQNGIKQGGVLSPTFLCVYFDESLNRLKRCGVGCYIGNAFLGALSYADDIAPLAPTLCAAKIMPNVCEIDVR